MGGILLLHTVGTVGGLFAKRRKIPAGAMLGAMFLVVALNLVTGLHVSYPLELRRIIQMLSGVIVASRFNRESVKRLRALVLPAAILLVTLGVVNVLFAGAISSASHLTVITALLAAAPGGVTDLAIIAADFGADPEQVAILQIVRFVVVVTIAPILIRRMQAKAPAPEAAHASTAPEEAHCEAEPPRGRLALRAVLTIGVAMAGSLLFQWIGVPAGAIIGSIAATVLLNLTMAGVYVPRVLKPVVQIGAGCYIGAQLTLSVLASLPELLVPMLLLLVEVAVMVFGTSFLIHKITKLDLLTSIFSSVPGGMTELGIMAEEMGLDIPRVILMHTCRVIFVICMMPLMLRVLAG